MVEDFTCTRDITDVFKTSRNDLSALTPFDQLQYLYKIDDSPVFLGDHFLMRSLCNIIIVA